MNTITKNHKQNWANLANTIEKRKKPLGVGLRNQCFIGLAIEIANLNNSNFENYYGISIWESRDMIRANNNCLESIRNTTMANFARSLG